MKHSAKLSASLRHVSPRGLNSEAADDYEHPASALNRRIQRFEEEFGVEIFERLPRRGCPSDLRAELLMQHFLMQGNRICAGEEARSLDSFANDGVHVDGCLALRR